MFREGIAVGADVARPFFSVPVGLSIGLESVQHGAVNFRRLMTLNVAEVFSETFR